jgi:membrane dipeptidase
MKRYAAIAAIALLFFGGFIHAQSKLTEDQIQARAKKVHAEAIPIDTHVDIPETWNEDPGTLTRNKCDLVKMKNGGLKGVFMAVYEGQPRTADHGLTPEGYKRVYDAAMRKFDAVHNLAEKMHPELCGLAVTPAQVEQIAKTGKRVIMIGIENGYPVGDDLGNIKKFYDLGARYITLSHSGHNQICDSSSDTAPPLNNGVSEFGKKVIAEMNRLGIMVDVSHIAAKSFWDVIAASKAPIIASHSGCTAVAKSDRNLDDDQLKALAKNGGVIQVVALASYLKNDSPERTEAIAKLREELGMPAGGRGGAGRGGAGGGGRGQGGQAGQAPPAQTPEQQAEMQKRRAQYQERMKEIDAKHPGATLKDFVDHIDHAVKVAGVDHVGVGTDFDGGGGVPGFNDHSEAFNVTVELVRRGYSDQDIKKIWGGNLLRVWKEVGAVARKAGTKSN